MNRTALSKSYITVDGNNCDLFPDLASNVMTASPMLGGSAATPEPTGVVARNMAVGTFGSTLIVFVCCAVRV